MTQGAATLEVVLANEKFRLKAPAENHAKLLEVAEAVNQRIQSLHQDGGALTIQRAALMAAFQFAFELDEVTLRSGMSQSDFREAAEKIDSLIAQIEKEVK